MRSVGFSTVVVAIFFTASLCAAEPTTGPATAPAELKANDVAGIKAGIGKTVTILAKIKSAEWSSTGKVMNIELDDAADSKLMFAVFSNKREGLDAVFSGDFAKTIAGATIRVTGKLAEFKSRPQIIIDKHDQVEIVTPATKPSAK